MNHRLLTLALIVVAALVHGVGYAAVGRTPGQFNVSSTGSARYTIPIWAAPGPRGVQPNIALTYDSRSAIGPMGVGWSIAGLGAITRCNKTVAQDTTAAPVALATSDGYCLNGARLRLTSGTYGEAGSVYQTEIADFSQITANGTTGNGPQYFTVQGRNGLTYYYGWEKSGTNGANSQVLANGFSPSTAITWLLSMVVDRAGNNYVVNYTTLSNTLIGTAVPSTIYWTPTSAGGSSYTYTMQFNYSANAAQSSINKYVAGTQVYNPQLLSSIEILLGSTVVKDYFLGYTPSTTTGRKQLTSVQECPTATQSNANCFAATTVTYANPSAGVSSTPNTVSGGSPAGVIYDLNGDGIPDLVFTSGGTVYVAFGSVSGYGTPTSTGITVSSYLLLGNLNAGPEDGIFAVKGSTWYYYTYNGSTFEGVSTGLAFDSTAQQYMLADVNGDGRADLVYLYCSNGKATVDTRLNTSSGSTISFSPTLTTAYSTSGSFYEVNLYGPNNSATSKLRRFDFNGDGLDDLVLETFSLNKNIYTNSFDQLVSNGSTFTAHGIDTQVSVGTVPLIPLFWFLDWNDDACTDVEYGNTLIVSGCDGSTPLKVTVPSGTVVGVLDWDGDGRTDLLVATGGIGTNLEVYLSTGGAPTSAVSTSIPYSGDYYLTLDATGGGLDDLASVGNNTLTYYLHNGIPDLATEFADGYGNFAKPSYVSIANRTNYSPGSAAVYPNKTYIAPIYVVSEAVFNDAGNSGNTWNQQFSYTDAETNVEGRGFVGFGTMQMYDSRTTLWDTKDYDLAFPFYGMVTIDELAQNSNNTYPVNVFSGTPQSMTLSGATNEERYFPYFPSTTQKRYELGGSENGDLITTVGTTYSFDSYGNATSIARTLTDDDPYTPYPGGWWTATITNTTDISTHQTADLEAWCLNMLDDTQVAYTSNYGSSVTRTKMFTPDTPSECRVKTIVTEPTANSGAYKVTENLTFDSFGNVQTDTVTGAVMGSSPASREVQLNWGPTGQFLWSSQDPSGATTHWTYTSNQALTFGIPDTQKDANALTTSWGYDAFGRKTSEKRPDGTSTVWAWSLCTSNCGFSNAMYQVAKTSYEVNGTGVIDLATNLFDPADRLIETQVPNLSFTQTTVQTKYDWLGRVTAKSMPFVTGAPEYWQSFGYDHLNRLGSTSRPISSTNATLQSTNYLYVGRATTILDPYQNARIIVSDVNGWQRQTKDGYGYTVTSAYDAAGSVTGVTDSVGNTLMSSLVYKYGLKPYLVSGTDADRGAFTNTYDSLGERTSWTDAKMQPFSMTYDALSRPLTRTEPDLFTAWNYGTVAPAIGKMIGACTQSSSSNNACNIGSWLDSETRTYDSLARPQTLSIVQNGNPGNDGGGAYTYTWGYDPNTGLISTLTYPKTTSGYALALSYNFTYTMLRSIGDTSDSQGTSGTSCILWDAHTNDGFGHITSETLGNGVMANRNYDGVTSWLGQSIAGVGGGMGILNQSYLYDDNGNLIQRQDNNLGLTESFLYDKDSRLTCVQLSGTCTGSTFVYDGGAAGPGNITSQTGVGTYSYPTPGQARPHAVTSVTGSLNGITNPSFTYDNNGNMLTRGNASQQITWSSYNYPLAVSVTDPAGSEEVQFNYGPDRQRWEQIYGAERTYYVGKNLEVVFNGSTTYRYYIYAGPEPIAIYNRVAGGANTMSYSLGDHQGSVSSITTNAGAVAVDDSFSPFGQLRNSQTWSGAPTSSETNALSTLTRQGYTFQTWLGQSMRLNHMNGRVEDAILGRFLSPDPHIPDPTNAQSYNRYSYVNNNPLTLVDPSGFTEKDCSNGCGGSVNIIVAWLDEPDVEVPTPDLPPIEGSDSGFDNSGSAAGAPGTQNAGAGNSGAGMAPAAQSQNGVMPSGSCNPTCPEVTVTTSPATAPAFFLGGSTIILAPSGTDFQALWQLGRRFAAQGLSRKQLAAQIVNNPAINLQILSAKQGLGYGLYQDAANFAVGVVSEGYFGGSDLGWVEMSGGGQWYGYNNSTNWSPAMSGYWQGWWNAGWSAASSGNYPVQVGTPLQMS